MLHFFRYRRREAALGQRFEGLQAKGRLFAMEILRQILTGECQRERRICSWLRVRIVNQTN
jgi:hypothetical protein